VSAAALASFAALRNRMGEAVIGQPAVIEALLIALLADGHVLLEGLPGLAKTRAIKALGRALRARLARVQFTPDLLPSDLIGAEVYRQGGAEEARFVFQPGPIFAPLVLADEINRAPAMPAAPPNSTSCVWCVTRKGRSSALQPKRPRPHRRLPPQPRPRRPSARAMPTRPTRSRA